MSRSAGRRGSVLILVPVLASLVLALLAPSAVAAASHSAVERAKVIVTFHGPPGKAAERVIEKYGGKVDKKLALVNGLAARVPKGQLKQLAGEPGVKTVEPDVSLQAFDLEYDNAWGVKQIGTQAVHDAGIWGDGVKVAVIDTGIDYIHDDPRQQPYVVDPEFLHNYKGGYDFVNNDADPMDDNGHGTHVAGILAAEKNGYLVVGVAPHVDLYALKILDAAGNGDESNLILALQWAVDHDIDVVNMSLGTHTRRPGARRPRSRTRRPPASSWSRRPATRSPSRTIFYGCPVAYPAAYPQVLSTTFTNQSDALTGFSCTGPEVDFASPGDHDLLDGPGRARARTARPHGYTALERDLDGVAPPRGRRRPAPLARGSPTRARPGCSTTCRAQLCSTADDRLRRRLDADPDERPALREVLRLRRDRRERRSACRCYRPTPRLRTDDTATTAEDTPVSVTVLANDTDPNNDPLTVTGATDPPHGTAAVQGDGTVLYTPDANYNGSDSFTYTVSDGTHTDTGAVAMTVTPGEDPPVATDDALVTLLNTAANVAVLANDTDIDGDALTVTGASVPSHGTATVLPDGSITYAPNLGYNGSDGFDYTVSDGNGGSDVGHVAVTVAASSTPPNAVDDAAGVNEDGSVDVAVLANDSDPNGGGLTVTSVGAAAHGIATLNGNGTVHYVPAANYNGADSFGYSIRDSIGFTDSATVSVTVSPVNDPPTAASDTASTQRGHARPRSTSVANDSDVDGDTLTPIAIGGSPVGAVAINGNGTIQYTPPPNYYGSDSFSYTVSDGHGGTASANVSVTIAAVNDAPTADPKTLHDELRDCSHGDADRRRRRDVRSVVPDRHAAGSRVARAGSAARSA